jgi:hypothetical protein
MLQTKQHGAPSRQLLCSGLATAAEDPGENFGGPHDTDISDKFFKPLQFMHLYHASMCLAIAAVFEKNDAMIMYSTTDTQQHETR